MLRSLLPIFSSLSSLVLLLLIFNVLVEADKNPFNQGLEPEEKSWPPRLRLFAQNKHEHLWMFPKGRVIEQTISSKNKSEVVATIFCDPHPTEGCPNVEKLKGFKYSVRAKSDPNYFHEVQLTKDLKGFEQTSNCTGSDTPPINSVRGVTELKFLNCKALNSGDGSEFILRIDATEVERNFHIIFEKAKFSNVSRSVLKIDDASKLPPGISVAHGETDGDDDFYELSLSTKTSVKFSSDEEVPFFFKAPNDECKNFKANLEFGCKTSFSVEIKNESLHLVQGGKVLLQVGMTELNTLMFSLAKDALSIVKIKNNPSDHEQRENFGYISHGNEFVSTSFHKCNERGHENDTTLTIFPNATSNDAQCESSLKLVFGDAVTFLENEYFGASASNASSASTDETSTASFKWWHGLIIAILIIFAIGGIFLLIAYRQKWLCFKKRASPTLPVAKSPMPELEEEDLSSLKDSIKFKTKK